jgi:hypothetical protein
MNSGEPEPLTDLQTLISQKRNFPSLTCSVVSEASRWLKSQLRGADVSFQYGACDDRDHYGYSIIIIPRSIPGGQFILEVKIAEIGERAHVFAEVRMIGRSNGNLFPYFGQFHTNEERLMALQYISDFLLATETEEERAEAADPSQS